jgi:hypothetical protein
VLLPSPSCLKWKAKRLVSILRGSYQSRLPHLFT